MGRAIDRLTIGLSNNRSESISPISADLPQAYGLGTG
jgi:hypothetical protein